MPTTITQGIASFTAGGDYCDKLSIENKTSIIERKNSAGITAKVKDLDPMGDFSFNGGGDAAVALGSMSGTVPGISTGVKMVKSYKHELVNDNFDTYEASGTNYPGATLAT